MGLLVWLDLEPVDGFALFFSDILGLMAGWLLWPHMFLAFAAYIFISYHLFLAWLVMTSDRRVGLSSHIVSTAFTHLACFLLACFCILLASTLHGDLVFYLIFRPIRYCLFAGVPGLAVFERGWLFSVSPKRAEETLVTQASPEIAAVHAAATGDDYEAWLQHLAQRNPLSRKPGTSLKDEYEQFMVARVKSRAAAPSGNNPA
jgi:hypothetical protein